ncbi:AraC family transcriptional regulator [Paenibacillus planticolens]|uniref:DNA gyrase inhibitor n=1 Tax=Paenibacillus planticolens TaxID=2654976 RepID=A0ABX1ZR16_9BACL|nr:GyrI-like domain-containing protein [Paenibacillus planticolens]NOV02507.1 DNA gyrase inhibitor [Paenibacillus planticolens]
MDFNVEMIPNYRIAYVRQVGPYGPANVQAMQKLKQWAGERNSLTRSAILFGIPQDNPLTTPPDNCRYDACIVLPETEPIDQAVCEGKFAGATYAVCKIKHTTEEVQKAWAEIFPALQSGGYRIADKPIVERYTGDLLDTEFCEICVPLSDSRDRQES